MARRGFRPNPRIAPRPIHTDHLHFSKGLNVSVSWFWLLMLLATAHFVRAQEPVVSTPDLRTNRDFACSVEPRLTPIPELWSIYPGELRVDLVIGSTGEVKEAKAVKSSFAPGDTESALKILKTWRFDPATKNAYPVSLHESVSLIFSTTSANLKFEFLFPNGKRGCVRMPMPTM